MVVATAYGSCSTMLPAVGGVEPFSLTTAALRTCRTNGRSVCCWAVVCSVLLVPHDNVVARDGKNCLLTRWPCMETWCLGLGTWLEHSICGGLGTQQIKYVFCNHQFEIIRSRVTEAGCYGVDSPKQVSRRTIGVNPLDIGVLRGVSLLWSVERCIHRSSSLRVGCTVGRGCCVTQWGIGAPRPTRTLRVWVLATNSTADFSSLQLCNCVHQADALRDQVMCLHHRSERSEHASCQLRPKFPNPFTASHLLSFVVCCCVSVLFVRLGCW